MEAALTTALGSGDDARSPLPWVSWGIVFGLAGYLLALPVESYLARFAIGDALAYPRIAWHVAAGHGSTYDGLSTTTGYHPLWMWVHVPLMVGAESILARMSAVRALWIATACASVWIWSAWLGRLTGDALARAVLVAVMGSFGWSIYVLFAGPETPLVVSMIGISLWLADDLTRRGCVTGWRCAGFGLACAATVLARVDSLVLVAPLFAYTIWSVQRTSRLWAAVAAAIAAAGLAPYLAWNLQVAGSLLPISGRVKLAGDVDLGRGAALVAAWAERVGRILPPGAAVVAGALAIATIASALALVAKLERADRARLGALCWLPGAAALHYVVSLLALREVHVPWHLYLAAVSAYLAVAVTVFGASRAIARAGWSARSARVARGLVFVSVVAVSALGTAAYASAKGKRRAEASASIAVGRWFAAHAPTARVAMNDSFWVGAFAARLELIDLNGLVGDARLASLVERATPSEIVRAHGCRFAVTRVPTECVGRVDYAYVSPPTPLGWHYAVLEVGRGGTVPEHCGRAVLP